MRPDVSFYILHINLIIFSWTRERSINYIMNYTAITRKTAEIEIDRYVTWPGQACGYKIGEMKIKDLRKHAENVLGNEVLINLNTSGLD